MKRFFRLSTLRSLVPFLHGVHLCLYASSVAFAPEYVSSLFADDLTPYGLLPALTRPVVRIIMASTCAALVVHDLKMLRMDEAELAVGRADTSLLGFLLLHAVAAIGFSVLTIIEGHGAHVVQLLAHLIWIAAWMGLRWSVAQAKEEGKVVAGQRTVLVRLDVPPTEATMGTPLVEEEGEVPYGEVFQAEHPRKRTRKRPAAATPQADMPIVGSPVAESPTKLRSGRTKTTR